MRRAAAILLLLTACSREQPSPARLAAALPPLPPPGVKLEALPTGNGSAIANAHCLTCHSGDMLRQQRLTEAQWTAVVGKMGRWGSGVGESDRAQLIAYLAHHFGPENRFTPVETQPIEER